MIELGLPANHLPQHARAGEQTAPLPSVPSTISIESDTIKKLESTLRDMDKALIVTEKQRDEFLAMIQKDGVLIREATEIIDRQLAEIQRLNSELADASKRKANDATADSWDFVGSPKITTGFRYLKITRFVRNTSAKVNLYNSRRQH